MAPRGAVGDFQEVIEVVHDLRAPPRAQGPRSVVRKYTRLRHFRKARNRRTVQRGTGRRKPQCSKPRLVAAGPALLALMEDRRPWVEATRRVRVLPLRELPRACCTPP